MAILGSSNVFIYIALFNAVWWAKPVPRRYRISLGHDISLLQALKCSICKVRDVVNSTGNNTGV